MSLSFFFTHFASALLLPPLSLLLAALTGVFVVRRHPRIGRALLMASLALLWLFCTPYLAGRALHLLESSAKVVDTQAQPADAIVLLSAGTYFGAPEYGSDTLNEYGLVRARYAAKLQRETGKPILVSGGKPAGKDISDAQRMKLVLEHEFGVPVRWTEDLSGNTLEQARFSYRILRDAGITRIYLVTHAWHMARSAMAFRSPGFEVIPAPTAFTTQYESNRLAFLPQAGALGDSWIFMHELIGILWYWLQT